MYARFPMIAPDILNLFAARGADAVDVPMLQPAGPFLDMAGESLRRRIFLTESEKGVLLCLRPEFTIPVCLAHIRTGSVTPRRYCYLGEVFRQRREGGNEFFQAGVENLGDKDLASADARSVADAYALLSLCLPGRNLSITLGDQAVFEAVLTALGLPRGWRMRLARAFGSAKQLAAAIDNLAAPTHNSALAEPIASLVAYGDQDALAAHIAAGIKNAGLSPSVGRTPNEIARRLIDRAELHSVRLSSDAFEALKRFLAIQVALDKAPVALNDFATAYGLWLGTAWDNFTARATAIADHGIAAGVVRYNAAFGRPLDYYTGLVFEISGPEPNRRLAGGGRYDRLLTLLGASRSIPGVGFSVWLDRIEAMKGSN